ncbi:lysoplasmalogenase [Myxococcota bacterium]
MHDPLFYAAAVAASGALAVWGRHPGRMPLHWVFKPLPAGLLLGAVWTMGAGPTQTWVLLGLALSLVGDIMLMLPRRFFVLGLVSFLLALLAYAIGFSLGVTFVPLHLALLLAPLAVAIPVLRMLWPHTGKLRPAVVAYVAVMVVMVWRMLSRTGADVSMTSYVYGCVGGFLFMTSDSLLALRRFAGRPVPYPLELGPYFLAQWCLAATTWT